MSPSLCKECTRPNPFRVGHLQRTQLQFAAYKDENMLYNQALDHIFVEHEAGDTEQHSVLNEQVSETEEDVHSINHMTETHLMRTSPELKLLLFLMNHSNLKLYHLMELITS